MTLLIVYISLAIGVSFMCSIMEAVLLSVSPSFAAQAASDGTPYGRRLKALKHEIDRPLAAILSLNTIAHTVGAAGAGAQAGIVFGNAYLGLASAVLTLLILVLSEIIPKTVGALYWRPLVPIVVRSVGPVIWMMWPLVKMAEWITRLIVRNREHVTLRRDEFAALARLGATEGVLRDDESGIMRSLLRFGELTARDVMTPRTVVSYVEAGTTVDELLRQRPEMRFSRLPLTVNGMDRTIGFVLRSDLLLAIARGRGDALVDEFVRPLSAVPDGTPLWDLFDRLLAGSVHMALVVDEFGGAEGLVTVEDVIETLLGLEIVDEGDTVRDMQTLARERWAVRAREMGLLDAESGRPDTG
jgi:CBS domain containing-hemolysin-like protein